MTWPILKLTVHCTQGDKEKEEGLPVSPFMDRENSVPGKMVVGFIDFFVTPIYAALVPSSLLVCLPSE